MNEFINTGSVLIAVVAFAASLLSGCQLGAKNPKFNRSSEAYVSAATRIDYPDASPDAEILDGVLPTIAPITLSASQVTTDFWDMELEQAVQLALQNSKVLHDLGGTVLRSPASINSVHSPALQETDPRFGVEGALSAFDAAWSTRLFAANNDRALNNSFFGGGTRILQQDIIDYSNSLSKRTATGALMALRHNVGYDFNNAPGNANPNRPWTTNVEMDVRQPLLQGRGVEFNRIAGPGSAPGVYNGVVVARINTDISLADFEAGVRDLVNETESAYWELYFAYRDLDARIAARDRALQSWRRVQALAETGRRGGSAESEARAREQYYRLEAEVQNALAGRSNERSRATSFRGLGGIHSNERRLRLIMGLTINDGRTLRPTTEPTSAEVHYEWQTVAVEALTQRVELRRQQWNIKRRELELLAAKNHLLPQLDWFSRYRFRGLGHDLIKPDGSNLPAFDNAVQDLLDGRFQEWETGLEFSMPVGFRRAHAAVSNARLRLCHERAILDQQEREVVLEISDAIAEKDRAFVLTKTNANRRHAAHEELAATEAVFEAAAESDRLRLLDVLLDTQRRLVDSDSQYFRSLTEYMMSLKQIHFAKGTLLAHNQVFLAEGEWPGKAVCDARLRRSRHLDLGVCTGGVAHSTVVNGNRPAVLTPPITETTVSTDAVGMVETAP